METADVVVAGAGIVGCATAYAMAKRGLSVVLLDKGAVGGAVSGASLACIGTHMIDKKQEVPVLQQACGLWRALSEALPRAFEYQVCGQLRFIAREEDLHVARGWVEAERRLGLSVELLEPRAVREIAPALTGPIVGATWLPGDATVNPFLACRALVEAAEAEGAVIRPATEVVDLKISAGRIETVITATGTISTPCFVNATGPWARRVAGMAGLDLPIEPRKAQCLATIRLDPVIPCVVSAYESAGDVEAGYTQIQQAASGQVLFNTVLAGGRCKDGAQDRDLNVDYPFILDSVHTLLWLFPGLAQVPLLRSWARYEAVTPDNRFLVGPLPGVEGVYMAAGDGGFGFVQAPLIGEVLAEMIAGGKAEAPIPPYDPARFSGRVAPSGVS
jgi:sarcosine oxidase subunit beta